MSERDLVQCRYNQSHKVKRGRLLTHEAKCGDRKYSNLTMCPNNPMHLVSYGKLEHHKTICSDRPQLDEGLHMEMLAYIKALREKKLNKSIDNDKGSSVKPNKSNELNVSEKLSNEYSIYEIQSKTMKEHKADLFNIGNESGVIEYDEEEDNNIDLEVTQENVDELY